MAGFAGFNNITPEQVDQLLMYTPPPTPEEKALARELFNFESNIEQRKISAWMKQPGYTLKDAVQQIKRNIPPSMEIEDPQNRRDLEELQSRYTDKIREVLHLPIFNSIIRRKTILGNIPAISEAPEETVSSRLIKTMNAYYDRNVHGGKRRRNKTKKSKRKSRKTRRRKH